MFSAVTAEVTLHVSDLAAGSVHAAVVAVDTRVSLAAARLQANLHVYTLESCLTSCTLTVLSFVHTDHTQVAALKTCRLRNTNV